MSADKRPDAPGMQHASAFETAVAWLQWIDGHPGDADAVAAFAKWRDASTENREAAARATRTWRALGEVASHPVVATWRDQARKDNPVRRPWIAVAASLLVLIAGGLVALSYWGEDLPSSQVAQLGGSRGGSEDAGVRVERTALGERQHLVLSDGTKVVLNTASRVEIEYRAGQRSVRLAQGEAFFTVAKDPSRPFVVTAADRQVVAIGTAFGVRLDGAAVQVTLAEGRVAVKPMRADSAEAQQPVELAPGQQLIAQPQGPAIVRAADAARITSWQEGWIVFSRDSVQAAIDEVNRYTSRRIACDDARIATLTISGTFRTGEVDEFLDALTKVHPLAVERSTADDIHLVWRD